MRACVRLNMGSEPLRTSGLKRADPWPSTETTTSTGMTSSGAACWSSENMSAITERAQGACAGREGV